MIDWHAAPDLPPTPGRYLVTVSLGARRRVVVAKWPGNGSKRWVIEDDLDGYVVAWAVIPRAFDGPVTASIGIVTRRD